VTKANSPLALREIMAHLPKSAPKAKLAEPAPAAEPKPGDTPAETPAETPPAAVEETPAAEPALEPATEAPAAEPAPETEEPETPLEGEITPIKSARPHVRIREDDELGRMALAYQSRNRDWTLDQAFAAAREKLGIKTEAPAAEPAKPTGPQTVEEVDAAMTEQRAIRKKANSELRFEDANDATEKLEALLQHRFDLQREAERTQAAAETQAAATYDEGFTKSEKQAVDLYPFAADPNSEGGKRMLEIEESLKATRDPLYADPEKPLIIAQMVAKELRIAPRTKKAPVTPAKAAAPVPAKPKQVLPGGGSRTAPATSTQQTAEVAEIAKASTPLELRRFAEKHGLKIPY
jgi:hypothetical protein